METTKQSPVSEIEWSEESQSKLIELIEANQLELYNDPEDVRKTVEQVLSLDIRSTYQRAKGELPIFRFRFDTLLIDFRVIDNQKVTVMDISHYQENNE